MTSGRKRWPDPITESGRRLGDPIRIAHDHRISIDHESRWTDLTVFDLIQQDWQGKQHASRPVQASLRGNDTAWDLTKDPFHTVTACSMSGIASTAPNHRDIASCGAGQVGDELAFALRAILASGHNDHCH